MEIEPAEFVHRANVTAAEVCANISANAGRDLPMVNFKRIAICASGPSLADHIEDIRDRQSQGWHVATMNGSHNFLIEHGITPDLFFMVDARPVNLPFLRLANEATTYVIASQCHPEIFEALAGRNVMLWQVFNYEGALEACQKAMGDRQAPIFSGALNVGHSCLNPILAMGYRTWHMFGFDGSMRGDQKHAKAQSQNDGEQVVEFFWPMDADNRAIEGVTKSYFATPTMAHAAQHFPERISRFRQLGIEVEMFGDGLLPEMVRRLSSTEGAVTAPSLELAKPIVPPAKPRRSGRATNGMPIVTFKWKGHIPYTPDDVRIWARQVSRWHDGRCELVCITDDTQEMSDAGIDGVRFVPMWRDRFEEGRDWHRLKLFSEEMADLIGPRFTVMDLDTLICGPIGSLLGGEAPFKAWRDPNRDQYCTSLFQMDAGAFPHVWEGFDPNLAMRLRTSGMFGGYDQAWISHILPGQARWTAEDGVLSFRNDILKLNDIENAPESAKTLPEGARIVNFHGKYNPRDEAVQNALPWVAQFYQ